MAVERINTSKNNFYHEINLKTIFMKKIILGIAVLAIAGVVALNVNLGTKKSGEVSLLALANIEALADGEGSGCENGCVDGGGGCYCYMWYPCYKEYNW